MPPGRRGDSLPVSDTEVAMSYILTNAHWFVLLVGALVLFHELGHFLAAKALGVRVLRFSIGMGPRVLGWRHGETEYQLSLLPIGGYVKMWGEPSEPIGETAGEAAADAGPPEDVDPRRSFSVRPLWQRTTIVLAGPMANFLLAWLVYLGMFHGVHTVGDARLGMVSPEGPAAQAGLAPGDRIIAVDGQPVGQWDEVRDAIAVRPGTELPITIERAGQRRTLVVTTARHSEQDAFRELQERGRIGVSLQYVRAVVGVVDPDSPAARAGIRSGERLISVGGAPVHAWHEVRARLALARAGEPLTLGVGNEGEGEAVREVKLVPRADTPVGLDPTVFSAGDVPGGYTGLVAKDSLVAEVEPDTPAAAIGLQAGDRVLAVGVHLDGGGERQRPVHVWALDLSSLSVDPKAELTLTWQRGSLVMRHALRLAAHRVTDDFKETSTTYVFGARNDPAASAMYTASRETGWAPAAVRSGAQVRDDIMMIGQAVGRLVRGRLPLDAMGGPIMLFVIAEKSAKQGPTFFFRTLAMISVNIGLMNLLPVPTLDGGHLLFLGIEAVSRRPPSLRIRETAQAVGLVLIALLMLMVFRNDVMRFVF